MHKQWVDIIKMMVGLVLEFDMCIMPITTGGRSVLAAAWDVSDEVFVAIVYAVWLAPESKKPMEGKL